MDILSAEDQRERLDMLRRLDFNDAALMFSKLIQLAYQHGVVDGGRQMSEAVLAKLETPAPNPAPAPGLEDEIRQSVLSKFSPRGHISEDRQR